MRFVVDSLWLIMEKNYEPGFCSTIEHRCVALLYVYIFIEQTYDLSIPHIIDLNDVAASIQSKIFS